MWVGGWAGRAGYKNHRAGKGGGYRYVLVDSRKCYATLSLVLGLGVTATSPREPNPQPPGTFHVRRRARFESWPQGCRLRSRFPLSMGPQLHRGSQCRHLYATAGTQADQRGDALADTRADGDPDFGALGVEAVSRGRCGHAAVV